MHKENSFRPLTNYLLAVMTSFESDISSILTYAKPCATAHQFWTSNSRNPAKDSSMPKRQTRSCESSRLDVCDACGESIRRRRPRPVRLPNRYEFNRRILADTMYVKDANGTTYSLLNLIDDATRFQIVSCFGELQGPPASRAVLRHFTTAWSSWAARPHSLQVDRGKEFMALFCRLPEDPRCGARSDGP